MRISDWSSDVCSSDLQSPARGVGATSLAKLAEIAQHAHLPLSRAAESIGLLKQLPPRAANALSGFADIVRGLRSDASRLPPAELVRKLNERSRSEEHTSELQSLMRISYAVFCLKKKKH